ncbi:EamA family transporter [Nocardia sp. CDC160]|uniref:EamA family transporter n=1 Tax=Nocardia sp. CDC160 TaxID=3112166 RepID=UPI002DB78E15|nr:EamA family transporter [Nocardia sp. CDC160]MEC3915252.1 EamA family transporter [Nocardia sp. CDC160]
MGYLVLAISVFLHAGWNVTLGWLRRSDRPVSSTADMLITGGLLFLPLAVFTWHFELYALPFAAASILFSTIYFALLEKAYATAPVGEVYPIVRGSSPVLVVTASAILGTTIGWTRWLGVAFIAVGVLMIALSRAQPAVPGISGGRRSVLWGLTIGLCVASYTMFDGVGVQHASPMAYLVTVMGGSGLVLKIRDLARGTASTLTLRSLPLTAAGGGAMLGAFGLTLIAMTQLPIAVVASVRESSIVVGALLSRLLLHERISRQGAFGIASVLTGTVVIGLPA